MSTRETNDEKILYAVQGGGYAIFKNDTYVWDSEIPGYLVDYGVKAGDKIPKEWRAVRVYWAAIQIQKFMEKQDYGGCSEPYED